MQQSEQIERRKNRKSILVVDDSAPVRTALGELLEQGGWWVTLCSDGASAIKSATNTTFDAALVDFNLQGSRGSDVIESLRELLPGACIIGISFHDRKEEFKVAGADGFLMKPFETEEVAEIVMQQERNLLDQNKEGAGYIEI